jgi:hypothetical protein
MGKGWTSFWPDSWEERWSVTIVEVLPSLGQAGKQRPREGKKCADFGKCCKVPLEYRPRDGRPFRGLLSPETWEEKRVSAV